MKQIVYIALCVVALIFEIDLVMNVFSIQHLNKASGNGNPGLIVISLCILTLIWFFFLLYKLLIRVNLYRLLVFSLPLLTLLINIVGYFYLRNKFNLLKKSLLKNFDLDFVESVLSGLTLYTNNIYVNYISLLMILSLGITIIILIVYLKNRKNLR